MGEAMPRQPRLDLPGLLHHVIARGIERRDIFNDDRDRESFVERLGELVAAGGARLYAWCLLSNHFHLVLRTGDRPLAWLMRRLMTGHAVRYNLRHNRSGHLFQNRFKSIVVEEEPYFLELVRYVALNPVRARMVATPEELDGYRWSGHAVIVGREAAPWQDVGEVLSRFGRREKEAVKRYREFVVSDWSHGRRDDLVGGGLVRSAGGAEALSARRPEERECADERILGSGAFVEEVWRAEGRIAPSPQRTWQAVLAEVAAKHGIGAARICGGARERAVCRARREFFLRSQEEAGTPVAHLARVCGLHPAPVGRAIERARAERAVSKEGPAKT